MRDDPPVVAGSLLKAKLSPQKREKTPADMVGLSDLNEIEKINSRVSQMIGSHEARTRDIISLEEEAKTRYYANNMPEPMQGGV